MIGISSAPRKLKSAGVPNVFTAMIAFGLLSAISQRQTFVSIFQFAPSISTGMGVALRHRHAFASATHEYAGIRTLSPPEICRAPRANRIDERPAPTQTAYATSATRASAR